MSTAPHILARGTSSFYDPSLAALPKQREEGQDGTAAGTFSELLDTINPLHHIPGVNTAYRAASGDTISGGASILGSALFGGPIGLIGAVVNAIVTQESGKNIGEHMVAFFQGGDEATTQVADASTGNDDFAQLTPHETEINDSVDIAMLENEGPLPATVPSTFTATPVASVTTSDITPVSYVPQQLAPTMQWQNVTATLPEETITRAAAPSRTPERLPWMDDEPSLHQIVETIADETSLAPLPHLADPVALPAELPVSSLPPQAYHPFPLQEPAYNAAQMALDINA